MAEARRLKNASMTFMEHLEELRSRLIKSAIALLVGAVVAFVFYTWILDVLSVPYEKATGLEGLAFFRPTEAFSLAMRLSLFGGVVLASPVLIYQGWRFVSPALTPRERKYVIPLSAALVVLFLLGVLMGYWALERGLGFLLDFGGDSLEPVIGANFYLSFAMRFILAFGIAFEFPVFLFAAAAVGVVSSRQLRKAWRWAIVVMLTIAALITPSGDPLTLLMMTAPMYVLYELTILAVRFILRK